MSSKRKRGPAKCKKIIKDPSKYTIEFDDNGLAIGENAGPFKSWACLEFRKRIPYYKVASEVDEKQYDDVWKYIKASWKIPNDDPKDTVVKSGKNSVKNFRHKLVNKFALTDKDPSKKYEFIDKSHWKFFVDRANSEAFQETSKKASMSGKQNKEPSHCGRWGCAGLRKVWPHRWKQLVKTYPHLEVLQDENVKIFTVSKAKYNRVTKSYELPQRLLSGGELKGVLHDLHCKEKEMREDGTYYKDGKDVVTEVVGKGRQHGGRTRLVSGVLGVRKTLQTEKKRKRSKGTERVGEEINTIQVDQCQNDVAARTSAAIRLPEIESVSTCDLLWPFDDSFPDMVLGHGQVYPTSVRMLHGRQMHKDYVKIHVDAINEKYKCYPVPPHTNIHEELTDQLESTQGQFIQWPRKALKLLDIDSVQQSVTQHQQPPTHLDCYVPAPLDEGHVELQEVNENGSLMDLLTKECPIQMTHETDPKANEVLPCFKRMAALLKRAKSRPPKIHGLAKKLMNLSNQETSIAITSPDGMYNESYTEDVEVEAMMQLCVNDWAELSVMSWYIMCLYAIGGPQTAYFNPRMIERSVCNSNSKYVIDHIQSVMNLHKDRHYFMAPYFSGDHWTLIVIFHNPKNDIFYGYIIDSIKKGKSAESYDIIELFGKATGKSFKWKMVDCYQQSGGWECGYYVMKAMHDIVICCREKIIMHTTRALRQNEIDQFVEDTLEKFMNTVSNWLLFDQDFEHESD